MPKFAEAVGNKVINYNPDSPKYEIKSWKSGIIVAGVSFGGLFGSLVLERFPINGVDGLVLLYAHLSSALQL